jgi:aspartyl-tRNA(Asn)/glutamyl-tRNA(Gln) amidotransferase subunit A
MNDELHFKTIADLAPLIRARQLSPVELTEVFLECIEAFDPQLNTFITVTADLARKQAKFAESEIMAGRYRGLLHGIPLGLKDVYNTKSILTSGHSKICINNIPREDATATRKLYEAGGVLLGKLATHEFAHGGPSFDLPWPPARNPWNLEHVTGGSSSGPGGAVAAGLVPGALGTDTGGSIRTPACYCGVTGLKPTYGLVSRAGVIPNSFTFDHCGPMAWTVGDCAILLQAIAGYDPNDPASANRHVPDYRSALTADLRGLRIGVLRHFWEEDLKINDELLRATEAALTVFDRLGARLEVARIRPLQDYHDVKTIISLSELFSIHHDDLINRPGDFGEDFLGRGGLPGCLFQAADYVHAHRERRRMLEELLPLYEQFDVLLSIGNGPAPRFDTHRTVSFWEQPSMFSPFSVTGAPALVVCCGFSASGLPLGLQIVGRPFDEQTVFKVGHAYEQATQWRSRRPALSLGREQPPVVLAPARPVPNRVSETTCQVAKNLAMQAGLNLTESQFAQLARAAPYAFEMSRRIRRDRDHAQEPASVFHYGSLAPAPDTNAEPQSVCVAGRELRSH